MKQVMTIFKYTFRDGIRKKTFIVSTIIILGLILIACLVPKGIALFSDDSGTAEQESAAGQCWYVDKDKQIPAGQNALKTVNPDIKFIEGKAEDIGRYKADIKDDKDHSLIIVEKKEKVPHITVVTKNFMSGIDADGVSAALSKAYGAQVLENKGYSAQDVAIAQIQLPHDVKAAGDMNVGGYVISIVLTLFMFFAIYYYGYGVAMSIATEKASRVMETLVVSAKPSRILIGKCLGMGALGLLQFSVLLIFGMGCYKLMLPDGIALGDMTIDFSGVNAATLLLLLAYFVLGYTLYAVMNSVCGALVSKIEDLNSAMMPVMLIAIVSFYVGYIATALSTSSTLSTVASYVPFTAPFIMPHTLLNEQVDAMQIIVSIAIMIAVIILITMVSIRIYSASVLHYGGKQKLTRLYKEKV